MSKPTTWQFNLMSSCHDKDNDTLWCIGLCQDVMTKTSQTMSYLHSKCHYWVKDLMTVVINMHKPSFIFMTYVMSWLWRCHASLMHTPSSKVLPIVFLRIHCFMFHEQSQMVWEVSAISIFKGTIVFLTLWQLEIAFHMKCCINAITIANCSR